VAQFPSDEQVIKAVDSAGWLLEQQAVRALDNQGFGTRPNWAFRDPDEPTVSRELDVWAYKNYYGDTTTKLTVSAIVLVECKQSDLPYCAIGQQLPEYRQIGNPTEHTLPVRYVPQAFDSGRNRLEFDYTWDVLGFRSIMLQHGFTNFRATQLTRLDRKGDQWLASNAGIFPSLTYPLAKAIRASQLDATRTLKSWPGPNSFGGVGPMERRNWVSYTLRFPVILISCPLYVIDASTHQVKLEHARWVRLQRHLVSDTVKGLFEFDVVTRDNFDDYLKTVVEGMSEHVARTVQSAPLRYTGEDCWPQGVPEDGKYGSIYTPEDFA